MTEFDKSNLGKTQLLRLEKARDEFNIRMADAGISKARRIIILDHLADAGPALRAYVWGSEVLATDEALAHLLASETGSACLNGLTRQADGRYVESQPTPEQPAMPDLSKMSILQRMNWSRGLGTGER